MRSERAVERETKSGQGPFHAVLDSFRSALERELTSFLDSKLEAPMPKSARELLEPLREFVLRGGKRLRPALFEFASRAAGAPELSAMPAAVSIELLHTYLLIHDDIMDGAETRRGGLAAHRVFQAAHRGLGWRGDAVRHGESTAILMGDLAHSYAIEAFFSAPIAGPAWASAIRIFTEMCQEVVVGQYLEMTAPQRRGLERGDLLDIVRLKSGRYSVERPLQLGATLSGARRELREGLSRYGRALGEAFQLQDDLLGVFGDRDAVGKPVGGDLAEGKFTLLVLVALERAGAEERRRIRSCLEEVEPSRSSILEVTDLLESLGARQEIEVMVRDRLEAARRELDSLRLDEKSAVFFGGLIEYLSGRKA